RDRERAAAGLGVGDQKTGPHDWQVAAGLAGERAAVVGQQRRRHDGDVGGNNPQVHAPVGEATAVNLDRETGLPEAIEGGQEHVEVVDPAVPIRQDPAGHTAAGVVAQHPDQEAAVGAGEPAIDVLVVELDVLVVEAADVGQRDAELVGDAGVGDVVD